MNMGLLEKWINYESTHELLNMNHNKYEMPKTSFNFAILVWIEPLDQDAQFNHVYLLLTWNWVSFICFM
jgi:hypothetical protein